MLVAQKTSLLSYVEETTVQENYREVCKKGHIKTRRIAKYDCHVCHSIRRLNYDRDPKIRYRRMKRQLAHKIVRTRQKIAELERTIT